MKCPDCDYISFKPAKVCGSCGFNFKKNASSSASLFRSDSFTIFAKAKIPEEAELAVMEPPKSSQENSELKPGEFLLNLSNAEQVPSEPAPEPPASEAEEIGFAPMEFGSDNDINLEELEVEGLGLGLEPLNDEISDSTSETSQTELEEVSPEVKDEVDLTLGVDNLENEEPTSEAPVSLEVTDDLDTIDLGIGMDSFEDEEPTLEVPVSLEVADDVELVDLAPDIGSSDSTLDIEVDEEPILEVSPTSEELPTLEISDLADVSPEESDNSENVDLETAPVETEPLAPVLDLGEEEISLDVDLEPESPPPPPVATDEDEFDLKLEIDDSDGPLTTETLEIPEIEIEDLGLELEEPEPKTDSEPEPKSDPEPEPKPDPEPDSEKP